MPVTLLYFFRRDRRISTVLAIIQQLLRPGTSCTDPVRQYGQKEDKDLSQRQRNVFAPHFHTEPDASGYRRGNIADQLPRRDLRLKGGPTFISNLQVSLPANASASGCLHPTCGTDRDKFY